MLYCWKLVWSISWTQLYKRTPVCVCVCGGVSGFVVLLLCPEHRFVFDFVGGHILLIMFVFVFTLFRSTRPGRYTIFVCRKISLGMHSKPCLGTSWDLRNEQICKACVVCGGRFG